MTWARVDDGFWCHPKVLTLDLDARGLWVSALSWSCQQQTDRVPHQIVTMCGDDGTAAKKLVAAGLWHEADGGWSIHDWEAYQSERAKKAAAGSAGGKASGETRRAAKQDDEAERGASREAEQGASDEAGPSLPGPTRPSETPLPSDDGFEDFWNAYPRHHDTKATGGGGNKRTARKRWNALSAVEREEVAEAVGPYAKLCAPNGQKPKHAERFLINEAWQPYLPAARAGPDRSDVCKLCERPKSAPDHEELCGIFQ